MTLPKQNAVRYEITIPSIGKVYRFRPFTVKEEKALLLAKESEELGAMVGTLKNIIEACLEPKIDANKLASFDLQYIMVTLRTKSVGEHVRLQFDCEHCERTDPIMMDLDLTKVEIIRHDEHSNKINLFDDVGVVMKYPSIHQIDRLVEIENNPLAVIELFADCIDYIYDSDTLHHASEQSHDDLVQFIEDLTKEQFAKMGTFFKTMPKMEHTAEYKCPDCGAEHKRKIESFSNFFY